jgi:hypothetical protein
MTSLRNGTLPPDAQRKLKMAAQVGSSGSIVRRSAIDRAYRYIEEKYPEYLRKEDDHEC